ncbi:MAG: hypothetical protein AVDCRST_MAG49-807 [uncultured Thermomicrobiales bacterium]|uniref:Uncharacterized protein n=1 Tax=uncultured Thermomicrobiales bacterium TaxID=1645740 RepID=A0A6J4U7B7_9BACT|nr:MAG: hypothetical protein AVDCRST_MAG49-807 [uncultured Thermomicrobiales bacterium]
MTVLGIGQDSREAPGGAILGAGQGLSGGRSGAPERGTAAAVGVGVGTRGAGRPDAPALASAKGRRLLRRGAGLACAVGAAYFAAWAVGYALVGPVAEGTLGNAPRHVVYALALMAVGAAGEAAALLRPALPRRVRVPLDIAAFTALALGVIWLLLALNSISLACAVPG